NFGSRFQRPRGASAGADSGGHDAVVGVSTKGEPAAVAAVTGARAGSITASAVPTTTVCPAGTRIRVNTPAIGAGTSVAALSVSISSSISSASTVSPSLLSQATMVPSETVSPSCGIRMFMVRRPLPLDRHVFLFHELQEPVVSALAPAPPQGATYHQ